MIQEVGSVLRTAFETTGNVVTAALRVVEILGVTALNMPVNLLYALMGHGERLAIQN